MFGMMCLIVCLVWCVVCGVDQTEGLVSVREEERNDGAVPPHSQRHDQGPWAYQRHVSVS